MTPVCFLRLRNDDANNGSHVCDVGRVCCLPAEEHCVTIVPNFKLLEVDCGLLTLSGFELRAA